MTVCISNKYKYYIRKYIKNSEETTVASTRNLCLLITTLLFSHLSINAYAGPVCGDGLTEAPEECDEGPIAVSDT